MASTLRYVLDLTRAGHEVGVRLTVPDPEPGIEIVAFMPSWAPGSYLIREFGRLVDRVEATQGGASVAVAKTAEDEWRMTPATAAPLEITYALYAHELTVRTNYLGPDRALLCGAATFLLVAGRETSRAAVAWAQPAGWPPPQSALPLEGDAFIAEGIDALLDAPLAFGPARVADFDVAGVPHRVAVYGEGSVDIGRLRDDTQAICRQAAEVFGGQVPSPRYVFLVELACSGGLEHADSSVCGFPAFGFQGEVDRRKQMSLVAHEYFHLWNVKRIRPAALGPFDYRREAFTPHLWVAEGLTSYYEHLLPYRAGQFSAGRLLTLLAAQVVDLERTPGRLFQSAEESSQDAWVKYYRQGEHSRNCTVSYYGKGAVIGLALDLELRARTGGQRGLDEAFRALWRRYQERPARGYEDSELRDAFAEAAGGRMDDILDELARGRDGVALDARLAGVGLSLERLPPRTAGGWLGLALRRDGGKTMVDRVVRDSPAWAAGVAPGEEILALDGFRVDDSDVSERLDGREPGEGVTLTTALWGRLREVRCVLASRPSSDSRFRKLPSASEAARAAFAGWLGIPWDTFQPLDEKPEDHRGGRSLRDV